MQLSNSCSHWDHFHLTNTFRIYHKNPLTFSAALSSDEEISSKMLPIAPKACQLSSD